MRLEHYRICKECLKLFTTRTMYNTHISQVHNVKCDKCGVKFVGGSELKIHIHKDHDTKYEECNEILGSVGDLDVHKEKFHELIRDQESLQDFLEGRIPVGYLN